MLSSSCLKRPIEEVIFFSVFMNKTNLATVSLRAAKQKVLHMSCSHFIPMCVREVFWLKSGFGHLSGFRFGVLSQKKISPSTFGLLSAVEHRNSCKADFFVSGPV